MKRTTTIPQFLKERLDEMQTRNPSFSVRAFAKKLDVTPGTLSLVMLGKRKVSKKLAEQFADKLLLDPQERSEFLAPYLEIKPLRGKDDQYIKLTTDQFNVVGEWEHFAILNLIKTKNFVNDEEWIADRLGLTKKRVNEILERLQRLGLIAYDDKGTLKRQNSKYRTPDDVASVAMRKSHHETLDLAHVSLDEHTVAQRDFTWVTFAFDPTKMNEAKALIRKFQDDFLDLVQNQAELTEVYRMSIQLFPFTKLNSDK